MSINKVVISGNITRDAEIKVTNANTPVLSFTVAVNDRRNVNGEWQDYANYVGCTLFGKRATAIEQYMVKGAKVAIEGKLRWSQWERDGEKRSKLEVIVDEIEFMSRQERQDEPAQMFNPNEIPF